jgi:hypothetical protein
MFAWPWTRISLLEERVRALERLFCDTRDSVNALKEGVVIPVGHSSRVQFLYDPRPKLPLAQAVQLLAQELGVEFNEDPGVASTVKLRKREAPSRLS